MNYGEGEDDNDKNLQRKLRRERKVDKKKYSFHYQHRGEKKKNIEYHKRGEKSMKRREKEENGW